MTKSNMRSIAALLYSAIILAVNNICNANFFADEYRKYFSDEYLYQKT